jgi:hypothetical protein
LQHCFPIDVYDRDMTMDIWLIPPYNIAWEKARPYDIAGKKIHHILGIYAHIPVYTWLLHGTYCIQAYMTLYTRVIPGLRKYIRVYTDIY